MNAGLKGSPLKGCNRIKAIGDSTSQAPKATALHTNNTLDSRKTVFLKLPSVSPSCITAQVASHGILDKAKPTNFKVKPRPPSTACF